jgi:hypothetical protein
MQATRGTERRSSASERSKGSSTPERLPERTSYDELKEALADPWTSKRIADLEPHQIFAFAETFGVSAD